MKKHSFYPVGSLLYAFWYLWEFGPGLKQTLTPLAPKSREAQHHIVQAFEKLMKLKRPTRTSWAVTQKGQATT